jgi:hypothetical protein
LEVAAPAILSKFAISFPRFADKYIALGQCAQADAKRFVIKQNKKRGVKEVVIKMPDTEIKIFGNAVRVQPASGVHVQCFYSHGGS